MENGNRLAATGYVLPSWDAFEKMTDGIWEREYYTNHGPLLVELEKKLQDYLGVKHVVCMTNASIALMIAIKALETEGTVAIPAFSHVNIAQSVIWAGLQPVYAGREEELYMTVEALERSLQKDTGLVIAVNHFGDACEMEKITSFCKQHKLRLAFRSDAAFGQKYEGKRFGNFGDLEIFSFHESQLINGADGAFVCTSDDLTAAKLRNIRSSYGAGKPVPISYTGNGRMSEIQGGMILLSLAEFEKNVAANKIKYNALAKAVEHSGLIAVKPSAQVTDFAYNEIVLYAQDEKSLEQITGFTRLLDELQIGFDTFRFYGLDHQTGKPLQGFEVPGAYRNKAICISCNQVISQEQINQVTKFWNKKV